MALGRTIGFVALFMVIGLVAGAFLGLIGGLGYTTIAQTSGFEGKSGFVVAFWLLAGAILGLVAGIFGGLRLAGRPPRVRNPD